MNIEDLAVKHDYYCSDSNYYSNDPAQNYDTMSEFLDDYENCDIDLNLVFRFDVTEKTNDEGAGIDLYFAEVFIIQQRKGIFKPIHIELIMQYEVDRFLSYLKKHKKTLNSIWEPLA